jgi:hypothetical protein
MTKYIYVDTPQQYELFCEVLYNYPQLALDCETYVLPQWKKKGVSWATDPHTSRISLLTVMGRDKDNNKSTPIIFDFIKLKQAGFNKLPMWELLKSRELIIGANMQFDAKFIKREFGDFLENLACVINMSKLISNATGSKFGRMTGHRLSDLCRDYLDIKMTGKGSEQITDWMPRPPIDLPKHGDQWQTWLKKLQYAANDVPNLFTLYDLFYELITDPLPYSELIEDGSTTERFGLGMGKILELEMKMVTVAAEFEYNGVPVSAEIFTQIQKAIWDKDNNSGRLVEIAGELLTTFGRSDLLYDSPWSDYLIPTEAGWKLLNNPVQMKVYINKFIGSNLDSSQASVLNRLVDLLDQLAAQSDEQEQDREGTNNSGALDLINDHEEDIYRSIEDLERSEAIAANKVCKLIVEYKRLNKQFMMDLRKYINIVTGCIHGHIDMLGAATGRSSSAGPNLQNISSRTSVLIERDFNNLFVSSANYDALIPDWSEDNQSNNHVY